MSTSVQTSDGRSPAGRFAEGNRLSVGHKGAGGRPPVSIRLMAHEYMREKGIPRLKELAECSDKRISLAALHLLKSLAEGVDQHSPVPQDLMPGLPARVGEGTLS